MHKGNPAQGRQVPEQEEIEGVGCSGGEGIVSILMHVGDTWLREFAGVSSTMRIYFEAHEALD